jgi:hypothetical protein
MARLEREKQGSDNHPKSNDNKTELNQDEVVKLEDNAQIYNNFNKE